jgi:hypothetical protein
MNTSYGTIFRDDKGTDESGEHRLSSDIYMAVLTSLDLKDIPAFWSKSQNEKGKGNPGILSAEEDKKNKDFVGTLKDNLNVTFSGGENSLVMIKKYYH